MMGNGSSPKERRAKNKDLDKNIFNVPFNTLTDLYVATYIADVCPLCKNGVSINTNVGHGKKYLELIK